MAHLQRSSANHAQARGRPRYSGGANRRSRTSRDSSPATQISATTAGASSLTYNGHGKCSGSYNRPNGDYTGGSSAPFDNSTTTTSSTPHQVLHARLRALHPPQAVLDAILAASEARDRLTLQVYYNIPQYFDKDHAGDQEYTRRVRALESARLPESAGLLTAINAYPTMRATLVLLENESSATKVIDSWLTPSGMDFSETDKLCSLLQDVQTTLLHIQEASSILYAALAPQLSSRQL